MSDAQTSTVQVQFESAHPRTETRGVIMYNRGTKCVVRAIVSLCSLRQHYKGPITFFLEDPYPIEFEDVCKFFGANIERIPETKTKSLIRSAEICKATPYDRTLFLDCDTLITGPVDEMLDYLDDYDVAIPHFAYWWSDGGIIQSRIDKFNDVIPVQGEIYEKATERNPAINTGVLSYRKGAPFLNEWIELALKANDKKLFIPDEVAFQILYPSHDNIFIAPPKFNVSVKLDKGRTEDVRVIHFHGKKHVLDDNALADLWKAKFQEMRSQNIAQINSFMRYADDKLVDYLENRGETVPKEAKKEKKKKKRKVANFEEYKGDQVAPATIDPGVYAQIKSFKFGRKKHLLVTKDHHDIDLMGIYNGASIFVIANGPSFAKLDHSKLRQPGIMTYGMNNGAKSFRPDFWTCVDDPSRFIKSIWLDPRITKIIPRSLVQRAIFDNQEWKHVDVRVADCPNVITFDRNEQFRAEQFLFENTINWGNHKKNGGGRSVMLPVLKVCFLLGFRKIYLLGCDFNMSESNTYHFDEQRHRGAVNCNTDTYQKMNNNYFRALKPYFDAIGMEIYNCNPESNLKVFPYKSFDDAIEEATFKLGDVENERTWGMYSKAEEKMKFKDEPPPEEKPNIAIVDDGNGPKK